MKKATQTLTPVDEALHFFLSQARCSDRTEEIAVLQARGRVLAKDQYALVSMPPADNSAVDGYAVNSRDFDSISEHCLALQQRIVAGKIGQPLSSASAARIFTGACVPEGSDAVVMQEQCRVVEDKVVIPAGVSSGQNIRRQGEDFKQGDLLLKKGEVLHPPQMALLAAMGLSRVSVIKPLRIAVFSSGNELVEPGQPLRAGQIYNSNRYLLVSLLQQLGCEFIDGGILADDLAITKQSLQQAAQQVDLLISSGGASVGEEDYIKAAVNDIGDIKLWHLAIKPGKPLAYGEINTAKGKTPVFALPGNPAAVLVTFLILVRPYLLKMLGIAFKAPWSVRGIAQFDQKKTSIRREYLRAYGEWQADGQLFVYKHANQSSGSLSAATWANGFAIIEAHQSLGYSDVIEFLPFSSLYGF